MSAAGFHHARAISWSIPAWAQLLLRCQVGGWSLLFEIASANAYSKRTGEASCFTQCSKPINTPAGMTSPDTVLTSGNSSGWLITSDVRIFMNSTSIPLINGERKACDTCEKIPLLFNASSTFSTTPRAPETTIDTDKVLLFLTQTGSHCGHGFVHAATNCSHRSVIVWQSVHQSGPGHTASSIAVSMVMGPRYAGGGNLTQRMSKHSTRSYAVGLPQHGKTPFYCYQTGHGIQSHFLFA